MSHWIEAACARPCAESAEQARQRQQRLTKPAGSLGRLESLAIELAALQGRALPRIERVRVCVFAADHGIAAAGVSAFPQAVTGEMLRNFAAGGAAISVLARVLEAQLDVVSLGTVNDPCPLKGVRDERIATESGRIDRSEAMSTEQLQQALASGRDAVERARASNCELFIGGEMGIGNTTVASALGCALLALPADALVGPGTGVDAEGLRRKREVVAAALALHAQAASPLEQLRRLGGFEIAALVGACIAAAQAGLPVLVDGFIVSVAALCAVRLRPEVRPWLLFAHRSREPGHGRVLAALEADPLLDLGLCLGEASGAAVAVPLLRLACELHTGMATFAEAGVSGSQDA